MSPNLLGITALIYVYVAWGYYREGRAGMALAFAAYAISNFGFVIDGWKR